MLLLLFTGAGIAAPVELPDGEIVYVRTDERTVLVEASNRTVAVRADDRTVLCPVRPTP